MKTIRISTHAVAAIEAKFPRDWSADIRTDEKGGYLLVLTDAMVVLLNEIRRPEECYSDALIRIATTAYRFSISIAPSRAFRKADCASLALASVS
jgi:hypothetical protein